MGLWCRRLFQLLDTNFPVGPSSTEPVDINNFARRLSELYAFLFGREDIFKTLQLGRRMGTEVMIRMG